MCASRITSFIKDFNSDLEKAKKLESSKNQIKKLSNIFEEKSKKLTEQNEIIKRRISTFEKQQLETAKNRVKNSTNTIDLKGPLKQQGKLYGDR